MNCPGPIPVFFGLAPDEVHDLVPRLVWNQTLVGVPQSVFLKTDALRHHLSQNLVLGPDLLLQISDALPGRRIG